MIIALAQINPLVGDISGNVAKAIDAIGRAEDAGADLVIFGELSVVGYPPRDLLKKEGFVADSMHAVEELARRCRRIAAAVGFARLTPGVMGRPLQNCAALLANGRVQHVHVKALLPTYDVFDETRYFQSGPTPQCFGVAGRKVGITVCEDLWDPASLGRNLYRDDPVQALIGQGAEIIVNMAASPFEAGKASRREELFKRRTCSSAAMLVFVNQVGGNDELVFDGASCVVSPAGEVIARAASFAEDLLIVDTESSEGRCEPLVDRPASLSAALTLGLKDYLRKCGFQSAVLGLSGGIDSAVVAALAADAIGPENVYAVAMPSRYSSPGSLSDAEKLAGNLGINYRVVPIEPVHCAFEAQLGDTFAGKGGQIAGENIQARIRGNMIMAISNADGHLALATGNKSELATGYCTLYGDMCGGIAPIGDLLKTDVYALAEQMNVEAGSERICRSIIDKPPTAELKPDQLDQDKLPPYDVLDSILSGYIERDMTAEQIVATGLAADTVGKVIAMVDRAEYKRKQAAPVLKVTPRAFGTGRRMPIAQRYR